MIPRFTLFILLLASWLHAAPIRVTSGNVRYDFDEPGLIGIVLNGKQVASGSSSFSIAPFGQESLQPGALVKSSVTHPSKNVVKAVHVYEQVKVFYEWRVAGNDLSATMKVEHLGRSQQVIDRPSFNGPTLLFSKPPVGYVPQSWSELYLTAKRDEIMHPSWWLPFGCMFAYDDSWGFGVYTSRHLQQSKMFHRAQGSPNNVGLQYFVDDQIRPGETHVYDVQLRVGRVDWKYLIAGYVAEYNRQMPDNLYLEDHRPIIMAVMADLGNVSETNRFGWGTWRNMDSVEGVTRWCDWVLPKSKAAGAKGVIVWALQGANPRGQMYRPDADIFPPEIAQHLPLMRQKFKQYDQRMGACVRWGEEIVPDSWNSDGIIRIAPDEPTQIARVLLRVKRLTDMGFEDFYVDSMGTTLNDAKILAAVRKQVGPDAGIYSELFSDMALPYAGRYAAWGSSGWNNNPLEPWMRQLRPEFAVIVRNSDFPSMTLEQMGRLHLTPLIPDIAAANDEIPGLDKWKDFLIGREWR